MLQFAHQEKVISELEGWKSHPLTIDEVLDEAEEEPITNAPVKKWVDDPRDFAYDMEDVVDEFATEQLGRKLIAYRPSRVATTSKVRISIIPTCFAGLNPASKVKFNIKMGSKIKDISRRLDDISNRKANLGFKGLGKYASGVTSTWSKPPNSSLMNELVHGRDGDKKAIIERQGVCFI